MNMIIDFFFDLWPDEAILDSLDSFVLFYMLHDLRIIFQFQDFLLKVDLGRTQKLSIKINYTIEIHYVTARIFYYYSCYL
jgi:hypothetical protein